MVDPLVKTWALLIALTLATAALAGFDGGLVTLAVLALAWLKARLILGRFLHLGAAPGWLVAFTLPIGIWLVLIAAALLIARG